MGRHNNSSRQPWKGQERLAVPRPQPRSTPKPKNASEVMILSALNIVKDSLPFGYHGSIDKDYQGNYLKAEHTHRDGHVTCRVKDNKVTVIGEYRWSHGVGSSAVHMASQTFKEDLSGAVSYAANEAEMLAVKAHR